MWRLRGGWTRVEKAKNVIRLNRNKAESLHIKTEDFSLLALASKHVNRRVLWITYHDCLGVRKSINDDRYWSVSREVWENTGVTLRVHQVKQSAFIWPLSLQDVCDVFDSSCRANCPIWDKSSHWTIDWGWRIPGEHLQISKPGWRVTFKTIYKDTVTLDAKKNSVFSRRKMILPLSTD